MNTFRSKRNHKGLVMFWGITIIFSLLCFYVLFTELMPFHTLNPLWHEVSVDEPVIAGWKYGGVNEAGYLRFYNDHEHATVLPPNSHIFAVDDEFVVLENHSPTSLTFAEPYDAIPLRWFSYAAGASLFFIGVAYVRARNHGKRMRVRRQSTKGMLSVSKRSRFRTFRR